jgi:Zn-dependent M28 family amino/carboxypeptidase
MFNFDAFGSLLGWSYLVCNGPDEMAAFLIRHFSAADIRVQLNHSLIPYSDHFPFVAAGVPAAWIGRNNCEAGRFFHHRPDDDMSRVSCPLVAQVTGAVAAALQELANCDALPFASTLDAALRAGASTMWSELFGGWGGFAASE